MKRIDLTNQRFDRLVVKEFVSAVRSTVKWRCVCDCGGVSVVATRDLRSGNTKSCGCLMRSIKTNLSHGASVPMTGAYRSYRSMLSRCLTTGNIGYANYGGRGIKVCQRWQDSFVNFLADMGERPQDYTLERVDTNGDYAPENCKWIHKNEQAKNTRASVRYNMNGKIMIQADVARALKIHPSSLLVMRRKGCLPQGLTTV